MVKADSGGGGLYGGARIWQVNCAFGGTGGSGYINTNLLTNYKSEIGKNKGHGYVVIERLISDIEIRKNSNIFKHFKTEIPEEFYGTGM